MNVLRTIGFSMFCACVLSVFSCSKFEEITSDIIPYFPPKALLEKGIFNKYIVYGEQLSSNRKTANIEYTGYQLDKARLIVTNYNSGFDVVRQRELDFNDNGFKVLDETNYFLGDKIKTKVEGNDLLFWDDRTANLEFQKNYDLPDSFKLRIELATTKTADTSFLERSAVVFNSDSKRTSMSVSDTTQSNRTTKQIYADGMGLVLYEYEDSVRTIRTELVEQISAKTFKGLSNHGMKRVAFIDSSMTIMPASKTLLCDSIHKVVDYYNSFPAAGIEGGKGTIRQLIHTNLDHDLLGDASGYLTLRFVINCKGEIGWFTTEECDLDYNKKDFEDELVKHLAEMISGHKAWRFATIRDRARDSYAYLTFKLRNGEIIEILP